MDRFVDYMTTKRGMADALRAVIASGRNPYEQSRGQLIAAITTLLEAACEAGMLRRDIEPGDVLASLGGVSLTAGEPAQREQAGRLLDLLMDGLRYQERTADPPHVSWWRAGHRTARDRSAGHRLAAEAGDAGPALRGPHVQVHRSGLAARLEGEGDLERPGGPRGADTQRHRGGLAAGDGGKLATSVIWSTTWAVAPRPSVTRRLAEAGPRPAAWPSWWPPGARAETPG